MTKYRGQVRLTKEMLHKMLELPEEVEIINVVFEAKRELVSVIIRSDEEVEEMTFATGESMEILSVNADYYFKKKADNNA